MTTKAYEIPLTPQPQTFNIALAGVSYWLTLRWNGQLEAWVLDIADSNRANILTGIPVVTGTDLLGQYEYLGFGGWLIAQTDTITDNVPTFENLGTGGHLYFVVEA